MPAWRGERRAMAGYTLLDIEESPGGNSGRSICKGKVASLSSRTIQCLYIALSTCHLSTRTWTLGGCPSCLYYCIKYCVCRLVSPLDLFVSCVLQLMLWAYRKVAKRYPSFLEKYERDDENVEHLQNQIQRLNQQAENDTADIRHLRAETESNKVTIKGLESTLYSERERNNNIRKDKDDRIQTLTREKNTLEEEKQDALRRLSEAISVQLRDNNPNIVDLNDQCRPTKLAEMFSELYDNEWTSAFTVLEQSLEEKRAIVVLLDIVVEAYGFCEERVAVPWNVLTEWFLDMNLPGAQQTSKWLKDSRKANIKRKSHEIGKKYEAMILSKYEDTGLQEMLSQTDMQCYITKCIELCLLMVTTDPPVVFDCPGWKPSVVSREKDSSVKRSSQVQTDASGSKTKRGEFNKDLFKEYTTRGQYLDFIVWPTLFLHRDGPLLSKGVAQGSAEECREPEAME